MTAEAFDRSFISLSAEALSFALHFLKDEEQAKDVVQDVYLKLWNNREDLTHVKNAKAYLFQMVKNSCLNKLKHRKVKQEHLKVTINQQHNSEAGYEAQEKLDLIRQMIGKLPENQRLIFELRDIKGYEFKEIEQLTKLNPTNIRVLLSRARKSLSGMLQNVYAYGTE